MTHTAIDNETAASVRESKPSHALRTVAPRIDMLESAEGWTIRAELPGVRTDDLDIRVENGLLSLRAEVRAQDRGPDAGQGVYLLREHGPRVYARTFQLGGSVNTDAIRADLSNGVLTLELPKAEALRPRRIEVRNA